MGIFSKNCSNSDVVLETASASAKRDVTIVHKTTKRPDHLVAETRDAVWRIPLTLEEQFDLGRAYQELADGDEAQMLSAFTESLYQGSEGDAVKLAVEIRLMRPGEVFLSASGNGRVSGQRFYESATVRYEDVGRTVCEWIAQSQSRKELVADLVAALSGDQE
ncbi:hypothetical protein KBK24_0119160 [Burkholderia sp. K24]|nr:hypothetical protein KBK24_0119160 [Burkholderia sp. K24]